MSLANVGAHSNQINNAASVLINMLLKATTKYTTGTATKSDTIGNRINIDEVKPLPTTRRNRIKYSERRSRKFVEKIENKIESPKVLDENAMPMVHDRLPDPELWKKFNFESENTDLKKEENTHETKYPSRVLRSLRSGGVVRYKQLYCRTGFHLQILPNGVVSGTREDHNSYAILEFRSVGIGVVSIRGLKSGLYLAMNPKGHLYGSERASPDGYFSETILENYYNAYSTLRRRNHSVKKSCYIAIGNSGATRGGCRSKMTQKFTHFLPREVYRHKVPHLYTGVDF